MAATARSQVARLCTAGFLVCFLVAAFAHADPQEEILDLLRSMMAALSDDNVRGFMASFDRSMPGYDRLKAQITGLVDEADIGSDIEPTKNEGDDTHRVVDLDWYLVIRSSVANGPSVQRRQVVHCELRKEKKRWKIVSISPLEFFAPAKFDSKSGQ